MPHTIENLMEKYVSEIGKLYGTNLKSIILYGSYARGDYNAESDIDILILVDMSELEVGEYWNKLSDLTYDFNMDYNLDIKPIAKSEEHFNRWVDNYPFYANIKREGVTLYGAA